MTDAIADVTVCVAGERFVLTFNPDVARLATAGETVDCLLALLLPRQPHVSRSYVEFLIVKFGLDAWTAAVRQAGAELAVRTASLLVAMAQTPSTVN